MSYLNSKDCTDQLKSYQKSLDIEYKSLQQEAKNIKDEQKSKELLVKARGINVTFYQFLISFLTALIVVLGMRMMGTLLISSLIVFPAIITRGLTNSFKELIIISGIISIICFILGMLVSFFINLPTGASIVLIYIILLLITKVVKKVLI